MEEEIIINNKTDPTIRILQTPMCNSNSNNLNLEILI